jgi:hypothetical protein
MYGPDLVTPTTEAFTWTPLLTGLPPVRMAASLAAPESPLLRPAELLASLARDFYSRALFGHPPPLPGMTTVATGQFPPVGLSPAGTPSPAKYKRGSDPAKYSMSTELWSSIGDGLDRSLVAEGPNSMARECRWRCSPTSLHVLHREIAWQSHSEAAPIPMSEP